MPEPDLAAYEAAERLVREAHAKAEEAARAAAAQRAAERLGDAGRAAHSPPDLDALLALVGGGQGHAAARAAAPGSRTPLRELLLALRAVIDYSIERLERAPAPARDVEDIPIS